MTQNKQMKQARIAFTKACEWSGIFSVSQARYEFDKFLTKNNEPKTFDAYLKSRRVGAAFKISAIERKIVWDEFQNCFI